MRPPMPNRQAADAANQDRIGKAFAAMSGGGQEAPAEQAEDELLAELERALQAANSVLEKLKAVQQKESGAPQAEDADTGSPSMQGQP